MSATGSLANALALKTPERDHFLSLATPKQIRKGIKDGRFEKDEEPYGLLWEEAGRSWMWMGVASGSVNGSFHIQTFDNFEKSKIKIY
jgi:hypothetical protein